MPEDTSHSAPTGGAGGRWGVELLSATGGYGVNPRVVGGGQWMGMNGGTGKKVAVDDCRNSAVGGVVCHPGELF